MNNCDLESIFSSLAKQLPLNTDGNESFTFSFESLPVPPEEVETENLYIKKSQHTYNESCRYDSLHFNAHKETYRFLGLLILSAVFHPQPSNVLVKLNHPESDITNFLIEFPHLELVNLSSGYYTKPFAFEYYPAISWKHPFDKCVKPEHLPCFSLSYMDAFPITDEEWSKRDTVKMFSNDVGMVSFAELLLNAALPQNEEDEYELEGEGGFRGVGISSAEIRIILPGHTFWFDEHWQ
jgi:hypothetical protein